MRSVCLRASACPVCVLCVPAPPGVFEPVQRPGLPRCLCTFGLAGTLSDVELRFFVSGHVRLINLAGAECEFVRVVNRSEHSTPFDRHNMRRSKTMQLHTTYNRLDYDLSS